MPAAAWRLLARRRQASRIKGTHDEMVGVDIVAGPWSSRCAIIASQRGRRRRHRGRARQDSKETTSGTTPRPTVRRSGQGRGHRPDQGHAHGAAERRVDRGPAAHHRGRGGRGEGRRTCQCRPALRAAWAACTSRGKHPSRGQRLGALGLRGVFLWPRREGSAPCHPRPTVLRFGEPTPGVRVTRAPSALLAVLVLAVPAVASAQSVGRCLVPGKRRPIPTFAKSSSAPIRA